MMDTRVIERLRSAKGAVQNGEGDLAVSLIDSVVRLLENAPVVAPARPVSDIVSSPTPQAAIYPPQPKPYEPPQKLGEWVVRGRQGNPTVILSPSDVRNILIRKHAGVSNGILGAAYGVDPNVISRIKKFDGSYKKYVDAYRVTPSTTRTKKVRYRSVRSRENTSGRPSNAKIKEIAELYTGGMENLNDISARVGLPVGSVRYALTFLANNQISL